MNVSWPFYSLKTHLYSNNLAEAHKLDCLTLSPLPLTKKETNESIVGNLTM